MANSFITLNWLAMETARQLRYLGHRPGRVILWTPDSSYAVLDGIRYYHEDASGASFEMQIPFAVGDPAFMQPVEWWVGFVESRLTRLFSVVGAVREIRSREGV